MNARILTEIANEYATPVYVYDADSMRSAATQLLEAFENHVEIYYSIKANPALAVCSWIRQSGVHGAEIASSGELEAAIASGFKPDQILFAGPGKTDEELRKAVDIGVGQINAESLNEINRIQQIAQVLGKDQSVGIRLNPDAESSINARIQTSGQGHKFGIDPALAAQAINMINQSPHLKFAGIHTMLGSQILNADMLLRSCRSTIEQIDRIASEIDIAVPSINFGGGLGVPHTADDEQFDPVAFAHGLVQLIKETKARDAFRHCRFMIEPGRILVSRFGVYVAKVIDTKTAAGSSIAILDGGINHAMLPITANQYRIEVLNREQPKDAKPVTVGGPLCTSADQWRSQVPLDGVQVGDLIAMHNAGAYGLTASMTKFLSRETPAEVMLIDGRAHIIRERSNPADVLRGQSIPSEVQDD